VTEKLKKLEKEGIIIRIEYKEKPPRVEYLLTSKGRGLKKVVSALFKYGEEFL
jgi:DNA-binding HxlR family transcriptional regulator